MKNKLVTMFVVLTILLSVFVGSAGAQAYSAHFTTSITYVNVGTATTTALDLFFYADPADTSPTTYALPALDPLAAGSLFVGNLDDTIVPVGFQGDAIMESDQPMLVTLVQIPMDQPTVKNRALSNGFGVGAPQTLIATILKQMFGSNTIFSVQNADSEENTVVISFFDTSANMVFSMTEDIESGAPFYVDVNSVTDLPTPFNGSAVIQATRTVGGGPGSIVSSVMELDVNSIGLKAFEGVASGGPFFYMPSALCNVFGGQNTSYAIQNTSLTTATDVTVTYSDNLGGVYSETKTIGAGAKASFIGCDVMAQNTLGAAVVESSATDVIAIGKTYGVGLSSAFNGVAVGYQTIALPYVRWATDANWAAGLGQRTFITIQNVGAALAEGDVVTIDYRGPDGVIRGTHTYTVPAGGLANGAKFNSNASMAGLLEFGYYGSVFGGAAVITGPAGSNLTAVARVSTQTSPGFLVSEDYNSQPVP